MSSPNTLSFRSPGLRAQACVAAAVVLASAVLRVGLERVAPGVAPFALLYPAVLGATLLVGWRSGVIAMALGAGLVWYLVFAPRFSLFDRNAADAITLVLYLATTGAMVVFAEAFRTQVAGRTADALQGQQALRDTASRLSLAMAAAHMAIWQVEGDALIPNPEFNRLLGFAADAAPTLAEIEDRFDPGEYRRVRSLIRQTLARGERFLEVEQRYRHPDGAVRWLLGRAEFRIGPDGRAVGSLGVVLDITERKSAEERLRLLAAEVDHRANNLLTVVQGLVTLSKAPTIESLRAVIIGRIAALSRAHQLLSRTRWVGADLRKLVEEELAPFTLGDPNRALISGPDLALGPAVAQGIAMALHELATNAAKYGALSAPGGRIDIGWTDSDGDRVVIRWRESGGPAVVRPTRRGLGASMLQRALSGPIGGGTTFDWRPEGLVCELSFPRSAAASLDPAQS
ncbi:HWE histidine kinase domain-containing protein [Phenylobacterium immobile]|uniref:HWE histidine kinase domain-containing protein n=1 Tax=Phenylobacterium immobile TaxID=21 RepID=UPI000AF8BAA3|nr:HWE histidine kinase domain-containing protein [Phenylobacterium immobile]